MSDIKLLAEEYFAPRTPKFNFKMLLEMVEEIYELEPALLEEDKGELSKGKKFVLALPRYGPSEAWGDPDTMDRQQINNIFKVVRGDASIAGKIKDLNAFLKT